MIYETPSHRLSSTGAHVAAGTLLSCSFVSPCEGWLCCGPLLALCFEPLMVCPSVVSPRPEQTFASAPHPTRLPPFHLTVRQVIFSLLGSRLPCRLPVSTGTPASGPRGLLRPTSLSIAISSINNTNSRNEPQVTQASKLYDGICSDTHLETHCFVPDPRNPGFTCRYSRFNVVRNNSCVVEERWGRQSQRLCYSCMKHYLVICVMLLRNWKYWNRTGAIHLCLRLF